MIKRINGIRVVKWTVGTIVLFLALSPVFPCTQYVGPRTAIYPYEVVLVGKVVRLLEPFDMLGDSYPGLLIEVDHVFFGTEPENGHFEVYPTRITPNCALMPLSADEVRDWYPIGTTLRVIGRTYPRCPNISVADSDIPRLYIDYFTGHLGRVGPDDLDPLEKEPLDYAALLRDPLTTSRGDLAFEVAKDLIRLADAETRAEMRSIVNRILTVYEYHRMSADVLMRIKKVQAWWRAHPYHDCPSSPAK